jgi:hypothetical protein
MAEKFHIGFANDGLLDECAHDVVPLNGNPAEGSCSKCGETGFVICDPEYDVDGVIELLKTYPNDELREKFISRLGSYICTQCGEYFEDGSGWHCPCHKDI